MLSKLLVAVAVPPLALAGLLSCADYAIIDVQEKTGDRVHIKVPVPLALARLALAFAPAEAREVELPPEAVAALDAARPMLDELARLPDCELVTVEERDQQVSIRKERDALRIRVHGRDGEDVRVVLPFAVARRALSGMDGRVLRTATLVAALGQADGELVHVSDRDTEVSVRIW